MNRDEEKNWLATLTKGDEVLVSGGYHGYDIQKVERTTTTQVLLGDGRRFNKATGRKVGTSGWRSFYLRPVTDADRAAAYEAKVRAEVARIQWDKVPLTNLLDVLRQIP